MYLIQFPIDDEGDCLIPLNKLASCVKNITECLPEKEAVIAVPNILNIQNISFKELIHYRDMLNKFIDERFDEQEEEC